MAILGPYCLHFVTNEIFQKNRQSQFLILQLSIIIKEKKTEKKTNGQSPTKLLTDRQTEAWLDNGNFKRPSFEGAPVKEENPLFINEIFSQECTK